MDFCYSREEINFNNICIKMPGNNIIYYYEIVSIKIQNLYGDSPTIILCTQDGTRLAIWYDSSTSLENFEKDLNYFIESVLED